MGRAERRKRSEESFLFFVKHKHHLIKVYFEFKQNLNFECYKKLVAPCRYVHVKFKILVPMHRHYASLGKSPFYLPE